MNEFKDNMTLIGTVMKPFKLSHESYGERFYETVVGSRRKSGTVDELPVIVKEINVDESLVGKRVEIKGSVRTKNVLMDGKAKLVICVFADEIKETLLPEDENDVQIEGFIAKKPEYRVTPKGMEIADLIIAVNRTYRKSYYIPSICWGRNARCVEALEVGTEVRAEGRLQSRTYAKKMEDGTQVTKVAYELSISRITYNHE